MGKWEGGRVGEWEGGRETEREVRQDVRRKEKNFPERACTKKSCQEKGKEFP